LSKIAAPMGESRPSRIYWKRHGQLA